MSCEICSFDSTVDTVMWTCVGCTRVFHAACVGVPVQRNSLRKKDKKIDVMSYVLPCCNSCQALVTLNFDLKLLTDQQAQLAETIINNTEVTHRLTQQNNVDVMHEAIDRLEALLIDIKKELTSTRNSGSTGNVMAIKNHMTSLLDLAMQTSSDTISTSLQKMTSGISDDLRRMTKEVEHLSNITVDVASSAPMHNNPMLELDILDELKSLSANIASMHSAAPLTPVSSMYPSLEVEINNKEKQDDSGWRLLGTRKVWKADWTAYDTRKLHRLKQQKIAEKARKRKKQSRAHVHFDNSHSNNNNNSNFDIYRLNDNINFNTVNNNRGMNRTENINTNFNIGSRQNGTHPLPPDRELLAAAKDRFSRPPPAGYRPTMEFKRGEILNPHSASSISPLASTYSPKRMAPDASFERCSCRHSCFPRY